MKKKYEAPNVEVVEFNYKDQVVAASTGCTSGQSSTNYGIPGSGTCSSYTPGGQYATM